MRVGRMLSILIALFALAWQSLFIETHVHPLVAPVSRVSAAHPLMRTHSSGISSAGDARGDPATCPICRELAQLGTLLSPSLPLFHAPALVVAMVALPIPARWARRDRSHAWLGRGPPQQA